MFLVIDGANMEKIKVDDEAYTEMVKINDKLKEILLHPAISLASDNSEEMEQPDETRTAVIDLTFRSRRENVAESKNDLEIFAKSRLQTLQRLSMLPEYRKTIIIDEVCSKADSFPYIEHTLHGLNNSTWLKVQWGELPESTDDIYKQLFGSRRSAKEYQQRRKILIWLAYAEHRFTLGAIRRLHEWIKEKGKHEDGEDIDIDDELDGPLSRILSLSPNFLTAIEHNYRDSKINEYDNTSFLAFSEPSLRTFFLRNPSEDRIPPIVVMFELVTMVLTMAKSDAYNSTADVADAELSSYAAKSWSDYLLRLNPCVPHKTKYEYPGAESVIMMISNVLDVDEIRNDALAKIESQAKINRTNADKIAKSIWDWSNMYLEEDGYGPKRAKLKSFCRRMRKGCRNLSEGCQNRSECYRNVCKEIARAHAQNWRFSKFPVEAYTCFQLANQMLRYSGHKEFKAEITADSIMEVSEKLWGKSYSAQDYKCLAMALRYNGHYDEALSKANLGLELDPNDPPNDLWTKFELYDRIGRINFGDVEDSYPRKDDKGKLREALRNLDEAVKCGEKCSKDKEKGKEKVERTKQLKLKIEIKLNSCLEEEKKIIGRISGYPEITFFDDIVRHIAERAERNRGHWDNMHLLLNGVSDTQLSDGCKKETHKFIQYSAQGNTSVLKRIKVLYDKAIETLEKQQNSQLLGSTLLWRAIFWRFYSLPGSDGKKECAEQSVKDLLLVLNPTTNASFATKTFASWQLMDYYFEEFCRPLANEEVEDYLSRKEKAQGSMEHVIKWFSGIQDPDFEVSLSPLSIPLAIIYQRTKQEKKFFEEVDKTFHSCYKALTDNVIYNDKPSYVMLAKILALLGLEEQSRAAFKNWCLVSSDLNIDDGGQREKADRTRSTKVEKPNHKPSKINVECNGPCGTTMDNFDEDNPVRLCYYCTNTILCHRCWQKINKGSNLGVCRKGHDYIEVSEDTPKKIVMHELKKVWEEKWKVFFTVF